MRGCREEETQSPTVPSSGFQPHIPGATYRNALEGDTTLPCLSSKPPALNSGTIKSTSCSLPLPSQGQTLLMDHSTVSCSACIQSQNPPQPGSAAGRLADNMEATSPSCRHPLLSLLAACWPLALCSFSHLQLHTSAKQVPPSISLASPLITSLGPPPPPGCKLPQSSRIAPAPGIPFLACSIPPKAGAKPLLGQNPNPADSPSQMVGPTSES